MKRGTFGILLAWLGSTLMAVVGVAADIDPAAHFEKHVRPVLVEHCHDCHGPDLDEPEGNLWLDSRESLLRGGRLGPAIQPGNPSASLLIQAINHGERLQMPPKQKLSVAQIAALTEWVRLGAVWPNAATTVRNSRPDSQQEAPITEEDRAYWAFRPVADPPVPQVADRDWPQSPLDHFVLAELERQGLQPAPPAGRRQLIRRLSFDLLGLPPTPEEVEAFVNDPSPDALPRLVDRLLASPHYGERWGRHWLDVARYGDSNGLDENLAFGNAWRYRDWVIDAFNRDLPYNQFVAEQIAGDLMPADDEATRIQRLIATGFLAIGPKMLAEDDPVKMRMDIIDEQVDTLGQAVLGLTLGCARCHDHKYDPIPTSDYYGLAGIFKSTRVMNTYSVVAQWFERPIATEQQQAQATAAKQQIDAHQARIQEFLDSHTQPLLRTARGEAGRYLRAASDYRWQKQSAKPPKEPNPSPAGGDEAAEKTLEQIAADAQLLLPWLRQWVAFLETKAATENPILAVWHQWERRLRAPRSDDPAPKLPELTQSLFGADFQPKSLDELTQRYVTLFADTQRQWEAFKQSEAGRGADRLPDTAREQVRQLLYDPQGPLAVPEEIESLFAEDAQQRLREMRGELAALQKGAPVLPEAMGACEDTIEDVPIHRRGSHLTLGPKVPRRFPRVLAGNDQPPLPADQSGRLQLAQWLASPEHPLTPRVIVNRVWHWHFGSGLVRSVDNFGRLGERPSHPELLDWLTRRFLEDGWSLKALHRRIVLSSTYQMSTAYNPRAAEIDPDNRLRWRFDRRRLEIEALRDAVLAVSGQLDRTPGGSLLATANRAYVTGTGSPKPKLPETARRTVYLPVVRSALDDMRTVFDFADPNVVGGQRPVTTVAPQALFLLNSDFIVSQTRGIAAALLADSTADDAARVGKLYRRALSREPTEAEVRRALELVARLQQAAAGSSQPSDQARLRAWQGLCRVVLASNEFLYLD